jgi:hypothetical protein
MLKTALTVLLALAAATATHAQAAPAKTQFMRFQTPSKNIGCLYSAAANQRTAFLRCDILSGLRPEPKASCRLDWTGFSMSADSRARPTCAGDTVYERRARIIAYGKTWRNGAFACQSRRSGLRCTSANGRGFVLSRTRSFVF